jgi:hypothetical protein
MTVVCTVRSAHCGLVSPLLCTMSVVAFAMGATTLPVHAARPMVTDDARIVDVKACQVESWVRRNDSSTEFWALPACNPTSNLEITFGGALTRDGGLTQMTDVVLQGKTILRALKTNGWGVGLAVGAIHHPDLDSGRLPDEWYAYVPLTFSLKDDQAFIHINLGVNRDREEDTCRLTWGIGTEVTASASDFLIAETFGENHGNPLFQVGYRHWIVPNRVQADMTYGNRFALDRQARWFSLGLRLLSPRSCPELVCRSASREGDHHEKDEST